MKFLIIAGALLGVLVVAVVAFRLGLRRRRLPTPEQIAQRAAENLDQARVGVEKEGWHLLAVLGKDSDHGYLHTVGLWQTFQHPEIILFSGKKDPTNVASSILSMVERVRNGERLEAGQRYDSIFNQFPGALRKVHSRWVRELLGTAVAFYGRPEFPVLQLFWPDKDSRFPWENNFDPALFAAQPMLAESNLVLAGLPWDALDAIEKEQGLEPFRVAVGELIVREQSDHPVDESEAWSWKVGQGGKHFIITLFGDLILKATSGTIAIRFKTTGQRQVLGRNEKEWLRQCARRPSHLFHAPLLCQLRALRINLEPGMVYDFIHEPQLGGREVVENVQWVQAEVSLAHADQLAPQLQGKTPPIRDSNPEQGAGGVKVASETIFTVVLNDQGQYSIWSVGPSPPKGWKEVGQTGMQQECLDYIEKVWVDMRPKSLRDKLDGEKPR